MTQSTNTLREPRNRPLPSDRRETAPAPIRAVPHLEPAGAVDDDIHDGYVSIRPRKQLSEAA